MNRFKQLGLALVCVGLMAGTSGAAVIYSDDFSGDGSSGLVGTSPDVTPGGETWSGLTIGTVWNDDGTITVDNDQKRNVFLPFTPEAGKEYTVKIDVVRIGTLDMFSFGFTTNNAANEGFPLAGQSLGASPWMKSLGSNGDVITYTGPANSGDGSSVSVSDADSFNTLEMVLNTSNTAWTVEFFLNGESIRSETFATNPDINYVGFGRYNQGTFQVDNFELSVVPEPVSVGLLGVGGFVLIFLRHRAARRS